MTLHNTNIISINGLEKSHIETILALAKHIKDNNIRNQSLQGKILATLFFEPSTRTRLSFEAAMHRLGGSIIGFSEEKATAMSKGESLQDALKVVSSYADALVIRHPLDGSAQVAADVCDIPVLNAGDGSNEHPTQTLLDLFTIQECQSKIDDLKIAFVGDLKHGRTVHSLAKALAHYNVRLYFVSPEGLMFPDQISHELSVKGVKYSFHKSLDEILDKLDIVYMTRIQKERFEDMQTYEKTKNVLGIKLKDLENAKSNLRVLHPLPRVNEISTDVDDSKHAYYFQQAENGIYVRQALLSLLLDNKLTHEGSCDKAAALSFSD